MKCRTNSIVKLIVIGVIVGFLLILNFSIGNILSDREMTHDVAVEKISTAAGGEFKINDVCIGIPYTHTFFKMNENGEEEKITESGTAFFQPKKINYMADISTQMRNIGIYEAPVFTGEISMNGEFIVNPLKKNEGYEYNFRESFIRIKMDDKQILSLPAVTINGKTYSTEDYGFSENGNGFNEYFNCDSEKIFFSTELRVRGAEKFSIMISSTETHMIITGDWPSPGFSSFDFLPVNYEITDKGFTAEWDVPFDGDTNHAIGFEYIQPVEIYKMLERAVNYGFLFIIVPFIVLFMFEIFEAINLHPLHYLLSGAASIIFFLLLLSFSEHFNFGLSYVVSSAASGILVSLYVAAITKKIKLGFTMCFVFALMYGFLFMSLKSEDYALLIGSLFAFTVLALVMFLTRRVDWNNVGKEKNTLVTND